MTISDARKASWSGIQWTIRHAFTDYLDKLDRMVKAYDSATCLSGESIIACENAEQYMALAVKWLRKARFMSLDLIEGGYTL